MRTNSEQKKKTTDLDYNACDMLQYFITQLPVWTIETYLMLLGLYLGWDLILRVV